MSSDADYRQRVYASYRTAQQTDGIDDRKARAPYLRALIRQHVPQDRSVVIVDLGCGQGTFLYFLALEGYTNACGVDTSSEQVAAAHALGVESVSEGDVLSFVRRASDQSYDVLVALDVVEHLTKPELLALADDARRILKDRGRWILHLPNAGGLFGGRVRYADWTHEQSFTPESVRQVLSVAGFARVECHEDQPIVHGVKSAVRYIVWKCLRAVLSLAWMAEKGSRGADVLFSQNMTVIAHATDDPR